MRTARRAIRALLRAPLRTSLLVAVLAVAMGLSLIMITVNGAFAERLDQIRSDVGTTITVRPAGSIGGGFIGRAPSGGDSDAPPDIEVPAGNVIPSSLAEEDLEGIEDIEHVTSVSRSLSIPYQGEDLVSAIEPPAGAQVPEGFSPPVFVSGADDGSSLQTFGVEDVSLVSGRSFTDDESNANVAVLGQTLAEKNSLKVGDTFEMNGETFEVIGISTSGTQFGDNSVFMPFETAQRVFDREGEVDEVRVSADEVDNVSAVADAIREQVGEDVVDVATELSQMEAISAPISDADSSSRIAMIAALAAGAAIILFSVVIVVRQRVKEIGIVKAIGASNWQVTLQFGVETAVIAVVAAVLGALATFPLAQAVANGLVSDTSAAGGPVLIEGGPGPGGFGAAVDNANAAGGVLGDVDVAVSPEVFLYAIAIAAALAVLASVIPAWYVSRVKPAEVLRYE